MTGVATRTLARLTAAVIACALAALVGLAPAAEPQRLLVAYPAGGPADLVARQLAAALKQQTGQDALVENVPGAGGGIGVTRLLAGGASAWLVGTPSETIVAPLLNPVLGYQPEQLRLIGIASTVPVALVGPPDAGADTLASLLVAARAAGRAIVCGNYGVGSHAHLAALDLAQRAGLHLLHVPHAGVAPLLREIAAGRIELAFVPLNRAVADLASQQRLRLLALAAEQRDPRWPALPTLNETTGGSGFVHQLWVGLFVAASTGAPAQGAARAALAAALDDVSYRQQKLAEGVWPGQPMSAADAAQLYADETARYRRLVSTLPR